MNISVIVPVYNCEDYVGISIESVLKQTYQNWELILINDGSTDSSLSICQVYAQRDQRIKIIQSENLGPANARNLGLENAAGEYCLFMDSDDYLEPDALDILQKNVQTYEPEIIFYPYFTDKMENQQYEILNNNALEQMVFNSNQEFTEHYRYLSENGYTHPVWNKLYNKKFIEECKACFPIGVNVSEDYLFNLKLYKNLTKAVLIEQPLYHYVSRTSGSITSSFNSNRFNSSKEVYMCAKETFMNWNNSEVNNVRNSFITDLNVCINNLYNRDCTWSSSEKHRYIERIVADPAVTECIHSAEIEGIRNKITAFLIQKQFISLMMIMGKLTRVIGEARLK